MRITKNLLDDIKNDPIKMGNKLTIEELENLLRKASEKYYNTGESLFDDEIFDDLKDLSDKYNKTESAIVTELIIMLRANTVTLEYDEHLSRK